MMMPFSLQQDVRVPDEVDWEPLHCLTWVLAVSIVQELIVRKRLLKTRILV
jgi:hypothetical protein